MKKLLFGLLALFMMSAVALSCDDKKSKKEKEDVEFTSEEQFVSSLEDLLDLVKVAHIRNSRDARNFSKAFNEIKDEIDQLTKQFEDENTKLSDAEKKTIERKVQRLLEDIMEEIRRIQREARDAGVDESELGLF